MNIIYFFKTLNMKVADKEFNKIMRQAEFCNNNRNRENVIKLLNMICIFQSFLDKYCQEFKVYYEYKSMTIEALLENYKEFFEEL